MNEEIRKAAALLGGIKSEKKAAGSRENGKKGGRPLTVEAEVWTGNGGTVEQFYRCPYCNQGYSLSTIGLPQTGKVICGDYGFKGIENGCGKTFIVRAVDPYGRK